MSAAHTITDGKVVLIHYTLTNDTGEVIDTSHGRPPLPYLHGAQNIVPGLERALAGQQVGAKLQVVVAPEDGYGLREGPGPVTIERGQFPDDAFVAPGMQFFAQLPDGSTGPVWVVDVDEANVTIDFAHPLAGVTLHFDIEIMGMRDPTREELTHGHPHGPDGHEAH